MDYVTISAYQFRHLDNLPELRIEVKKRCLELGFMGTVLLAPEGLNCFLHGTRSNIALFIEYLGTHLGLNNLCFKENLCPGSPFNRLLVKIKKEIITMGVPEIKPEEGTAPYLPPVELKKWLDEGREIVLLDTRNDYEIQDGTFDNAVQLGIKSFREFTGAIETLPAEMKNKTVVTFCTGGIRCEKAASYLMTKGFEDVYQLRGGILKYFEDCKSAHYEGNCFVFDWRLAVDSELKGKNRRLDNVHAGRHVMKPKVKAAQQTESS